MTASAVGNRVILSLCDYSGRWSQPYRDAGYHVEQIDLKLGGDVRLLKKLNRPVHGILCAPVCTAFAVSGARHWAAKEAEGNSQLLEGLALVDACLRIVHVHKPNFWVLENPVGRLKDWIGQSVFTFNPCEYAGWLGEEIVEGEFIEGLKGEKLPRLAWMEDAYTKRSCLFGSFNEPVKDPRPPIDGSKMWRLYGGKSDRTKEMRSMTPRGFSRAFYAANP